MVWLGVLAAWSHPPKMHEACSRVYPSHGRGPSMCSDSTSMCYIPHPSTHTRRRLRSLAANNVDPLTTRPAMQPSARDAPPESVCLTMDSGYMRGRLNSKDLRHGSTRKDPSTGHWLLNSKMRCFVACLTRGKSMLGEAMNGDAGDIPLRTRLDGAVGIF